MGYKTSCQENKPQNGSSRGTDSLTARFAARERSQASFENSDWIETSSAQIRPDCGQTAEMSSEQMYLIFALLMTLPLPSVLGCFCQPLHPQQQFCNADAVVIGTVRSKQLLDGPPHPSIMPGQPTVVSYTLRVREIKKGRHLIEPLQQGNSRRLTLNTTATNSSCGVPWLQVGQKYVLTVMVLNGKAVINYCHFHRVFSDLSRTQRTGFNNEYSTNCDSCEVYTCRRTCPLTPPDEKTCRHGNSQSHEDYYFYNGICHVKVSGRCGW